MKTKVFVELSFDCAPEPEEFQEVVNDFITIVDSCSKHNIVILRENGENATYDSEVVGLSFTGEEEKIREILTPWFPDFKDDEEWAEVEKVEI